MKFVLKLLILVLSFACNNSEQLSGVSTSDPKFAKNEINTEIETWASKFPILWETAYGGTNVEPKDVTYEQFINDLSLKLASNSSLIGPAGPQGLAGSQGPSGEFDIESIPNFAIGSEKQKKFNLVLSLTYEAKFNYNSSIIDYKLVAGDFNLINFKKGQLPGCALIDYNLPKNYLGKDETTSNIITIALSFGGNTANYRHLNAKFVFHGSVGGINYFENLEPQTLLVDTYDGPSKQFRIDLPLKKNIPSTGIQRLKLSVCRHGSEQEDTARDVSAGILLEGVFN